MKRLLVALRPRYLTLKNTWFHKGDASLARATRLGIIFAAALLIPNVVYLGIVESMADLQRSPVAASYLIEVLNFTLLSILFFSNSVHALHTLFLSKDNDLLLAAPIHPKQLFTGKFLETLISSCWVMVLFYLPSLFAIGHVFDASVAFFLFSIINLIPLVTVPTAIGIVASILFVRIYPAKRVKELFVVASVFIVVLLHFSLRGHELLLDTIQKDLPSLLDSSKTMNIPESSKTSLHLLSLPFEAAMSGDLFLSILISVSLLGIAAVCILSSYRCFVDLYFKVYSSDALAATSIKFVTRRKNKFFYLPALFRAFAFKDSRLFMRDVTQPIQLILFIAMGLLAIFGLKTSSNLGDSIRQTQQWWDDLVLAFNVGLHAMITILFSARFLYPSVSAEGEASWILRSAPLSYINLLRIKFLVNLIPSLLVLITILISGCLVSDLSPGYIGVACLAGIINTCCISGISIGCGAYFSNMKAEHIGQITTGLGSFLFMLVALIIVPFNGFLALIFTVSIAMILNIHSLILGSCIGILSLTLLHTAVVQYFLAIGQRKLEEG